MNLRKAAPLPSGSSVSCAPASKARQARFAALLALLGRLRASPWGEVALKIGAVVVALLVLGWIGRAAAAGSGAPAAAADERDAAAAPPGAIPSDAAPPIVVAEPAATTPSLEAATHPPARGRASADEPVYLNQASVDELRRLPGVGAKRAEAILVLRQRLGRFQRVEDLLRVKGVGRGAVKKWRPLVRLDAPATAPTDAGRS
jgi:competence protein ComEA